jgi:hypothetical protein
MKFQNDIDPTPDFPGLGFLVSESTADGKRHDTAVATEPNQPIAGEDRLGVETKLAFVTNWLPGAR